MAKHSYHMVKGAALAVAPYSHYVDGGDGYVFITGQIGMTPGDDNAPIPKDMAAETRRTMDNLIIILKDAGLTLEDVVTARVFLTDFERDDERDVSQLFQAGPSARAHLHRRDRAGARRQARDRFHL